MKRLRILLLYLTVILALLLFFAPKRQLYYLAEKNLAPYGVVLSGESIHDWGWVFALKNGALYYDDLFIANLNEISLMPLLVYNSLSFSSFALSEDMQQFLPGTISELRVYHSVVDPLRLRLSGFGDFGEIDGSVHLLDRNASLTLNPSATLLESNAIWLKQLKKQPSGEYLYEASY